MEKLLFTFCWCCSFSFLVVLDLDCLSCGIRLFFVVCSPPRRSRFAWVSLRQALVGRQQISQGNSFPFGLSNHCHHDFRFAAWSRVVLLPPVYRVAAAPAPASFSRIVICSSWRLPRFSILVTRAGFSRRSPLRVSVRRSSSIFDFCSRLASSGSCAEVSSPWSKSNFFYSRFGAACRRSAWPS
jgi:hypothetical protein